MDPTILNPATRFARPEPFTRSSSHSPTRRQQLISHELDPLLANLSPTSTLEALQSTNALSAEVGTHKRALLDSVADVSTSDRAWGIKAALAGKKVREWYKELEAWPWPSAADGGGNGFEPFTAREDGPEGGSPANATSDEGKVEFWGHLPAHLVQECEERIESIKDDMETLELEELKEHVRITYNMSGRKGSVNSQDSNGETAHKHLDDFTAIITTTIMQTLPHISRLQSLLNTWSTRLLVLRQVPGFLGCLDRTQTAMNAAWDVGEPLKGQRAGELTSIDRKTFGTIREVLEKQVLELGQRLDNMLDALEGREDTLPERWIDSMDTLETGFGTWVVETEGHVLENELNAATNEDKGQGDLSGEDTRSQHSIANGNGPDQPAQQILESDLEEGLQEKSQSTDVETLNSRSKETMLNNGAADIYTLSSKDRGGSLDREPLRNSHPDAPIPDHAQSDGVGETAIESQKLLRSRSISASENSRSSRPSSSQSLEGSHNPNTEGDLGSKGYVPKANQESHDVDGSLPRRRRSTSRPTPLILRPPRDQAASNGASELSSEVSYPGSSTSDYFSDMSSPEIQHAFRAEYFGAPIEVTTPSVSQRDPMSPMDIVSRQSSQRTERGSRSMSADFTSRGMTSPTAQRSRASSFIPETTIPENGGLAGSRMTIPNGSMSHLRTRSASMQSFVVVSPNDIQNITVDRSGSQSHASNPSPKGKGRVASYADLPAIRYCQPLTTFESVTGSPTMPKHNGESEAESTPSKQQINGESHHSFSPSQTTALHLPIHPSDPPPLPTKSRNRFENITDLSPGSTPVQIRQRRKSETSPTKPRSLLSSPTKSDADQLEARISSILISIPAHIRLTSGPELNAPEVKPAAPNPSTPLLRSKTTPRLSRAQTTNPSPLPSMTLTPAQPKNARSRPTSGDPEIKLYHLHQSGKEAPIKLFVRLVGEAGERVMVRIGGGWADLGEYLKEYASHHGKRSVSDSRFAIQELPSSPITGGSPSGSRPGSSYGSGYGATGSPEFGGALKSFDAATPGTGSNASLRPRSSHEWKEEESPSLGGAGPKAKNKNVDVSPTKQKWVDGMMEQARHAAAATKGEVGELGKVGGTRRVFLRSKTAGV